MGIAWVFGGRVFVIESVQPMVRIVPLSNLLPCYWVHLPDVLWTRDTEEYALSLVGTAKYSQLEAIKAFFRLNHSENLWECAELVKAIYEHCRVFLPGKATPTEVVRDAQCLGGGVFFADLTGNNNDK